MCNRNENHAVSLERVLRIAVERGTRNRTEVVSDELARGLQALVPPGSWKKIWEEVHSLSIFLSTHLSHTTKISTLSRMKREIYIFIKKYVRSFIEVVNQCYDYGYTTGREEHQGYLLTGVTIQIRAFIMKRNLKTQNRKV